MQTDRQEEIRIMSLPKMQEFIREKMGDSKEHDHFHCLACGANFTKHQDDCNCNNYGDERWIICPLPIDPDNPSRGLWGMVDKTKYRIDLHHLGATVTQMYSADGSVPYDMKTYTTPTLALLKALAYQWKVEVEE